VPFTTETVTDRPEQIDGGAVPPLAAPLPLDPSLPATHAAFDRLAAGIPAASMTVIRDGRPILTRATGTTIGGAPASSDSPMVVASVSKLLTAIAVGRLEQAGLLDIDAPIPWGVLGLSPHPGWNGVSARELLGHAAGMPVVRTSWFTGEGDCRTYLPTLMSRPPGGHRGVWTYSNGNYCALGILIESVTGMPLDESLDALVFDPAGLSGAHLTTDGQRPEDIVYHRGVARLSRLGGAGSLIVSTDSIAGALAAMGPADYEALRFPSGFVDQYGFGYTGTVGGAVACAWVLEGGRTVVAVTVSGERPSTGGAVCDLVEPAIAFDLGFWAGTPNRSSI
jgi:D-alanyl-D-alanine carboxypeptidase